MTDYAFDGPCFQTGIDEVLGWLDDDDPLTLVKWEKEGFFTPKTCLHGDSQHYVQVMHCFMMVCPPENWKNWGLKSCEFLLIPHEKRVHWDMTGASGPTLMASIMIVRSLSLDHSKNLQGTSGVSSDAHACDVI